MSVGVKLLKEHRYAELWQRYCGFLDLTVEQFMQIQESLLGEQLELLSRCDLGRRILGPERIWSLADFRSLVPLTSYADYAPLLGEQQEDALPARPVLWQRTSGASSEYHYKWAPITAKMYEEMGTVVFAILILATARFKGDISFGEGERMLYALAPPPYATGCWGRRAAQELPIQFLPPLDEAEKMTFEGRLKQGVRAGLDSGIDLLFGLPSVLVALGEQMGQQHLEAKDLLKLIAKPKTLARLARAVVTSKLAGRPVLPKDLWRLRGIATAGSDASLYRHRIRELWGRDPLDVYGCTEGLVLALQTWDRQGMTFVPYFNFFEFIPEEECTKTQSSNNPRTVLIDEVEPGRNYEVVITNLHGGPFVRYRLGDMVTITSLGNERLGIQLPQMVFYARSDGIVDLAGFARLTEKTIGQAINRAGISCEGWTARKEASPYPVLHVYIELRADNQTADQVTSAVHRELRALDHQYADMETMLRTRPLSVTLMPSGAFKNYTEQQRARGADLAHLKPPHINPSDGMLHTLLNRLQLDTLQTVGG